MSASEAAAAPPLQLVSVNVDGLSTLPRKRLILWRKLKLKKLDIALLQETHSGSDAVVQQWQAEMGADCHWRGSQFWHHGTSASRGVAVLVRDECGISEPQVTYKDAAGRILRVDFKYAGLDMAVVNVYAPSVAAERAAFFSTELPRAMEGGGYVFVGGDFNCVTRATDADPPPQPGDSRFAGRDQLESLMLVNELDDAWLLPQVRRRGDGRTLTWTTRARHFTRARLDRWLTPMDLREWVKAVQVFPGRTNEFLPGDHATVKLTLQPPLQPPRGRGVWTLPLWVLNDERYVDEMSSLLSTFPQQHHHLSARDRWELLKLTAADVTRNFCMLEASAQRAPREGLRRVCRAAESACAARPHDCELPLRALNDARARLRAMEEEEAVKARRAVDVLWQDYGERGTFWFHALAHKVYPLDAALSVRAADGILHSLSADDPTERAAAADAIADHYAALFAIGPTSADAQATLLAATPERLSVAAAAEAEGPDGVPHLTPDCVLAAIAKAPRGKRPGSDGLPYEFYAAFKQHLAPLLIAAFQEAFEDAASVAPLTASLRLGLIVRLYKGGGKPRDRNESYRPITLLNCDYKLVASILALRMGSAANDILSVTQTAFVPGRDIADNVLFHLEEVDWLEETAPGDGRQGCLAFLDFEKAYDRMDRAWMHRCLEHYGFGAGCRRWITVLFSGTCAQVLYNGFRTRLLEHLSSVAQGSPLSPLIYDLCCQPLASYLLHLQRTGAIRAIPLPGGTPAPPSHQHADDTVLHVLEADDLPVALAAVQLFCDATNGKLNVDKSHGLTLGAHPSLPLSDAGVHAATGLKFLRPGEHLRHLGILLARPRDQAAAATAMHATRLQSMHAAMRQWGRFSLSHIGRLYIAKQVMASMVYYHAQFVRPAPAQLQEMVSLIARFVARPALGGGGGIEDPRAFMQHPQLAAASLQPVDGGLAAVDLRTQIDALQAKIVARMLHPRRHPWKLLMQAAIRARSPVHLGVALPFFPAAPLPRRTSLARPALSLRHADYLGAMRRSAPFRAMAAADMPARGILREPLFDNACIRTPATAECLSARPPLSPLAAAAVSRNLQRVCDLRNALRRWPGDVQLLQLLALLPDRWRSVATAAVIPLHGPFCDASQELYATSTAFGSPSCVVRPILPDGRVGDDAVAHSAFSLAARVWVPCCAVRVLKPVAFMSREVREELAEDRRRGVPLHLLDTSLFGAAYFATYIAGPWHLLDVSPTMWAHAPSMPLAMFVVRDVARRMRRLRAVVKVDGYTAGRGCFPKAWELTGGGGGLCITEQRWVDGLRAQLQPGAGTSTTNIASPAEQQQRRRRRQFAHDWQPRPYRFTYHPQENMDVDEDLVVASLDSTTASPVAAPLQLPSGMVLRARVRQEEAAAPAPPAATPDHMDLAAASPGAPLNPARGAWDRLVSRRLPRDLRAMGWRILHVALYSGVFLARVNPRRAADCVCCSSPACSAARTYETMQHLFLECPDVAAASDWLVRLWVAISPPGSAAPPRSATVLLADDDRVWQPVGSEEHRQLWTILRLCWIQAVWRLRCHRAMDPERHGITPTHVVAATVAAVKRLMRLDYARTIGDARTMTASPRHWFRGTSVPTLAAAEFLERWSGHAGSLCSLSTTNAAGQGGRLIVHLSASSPVALL